MTAEEPSPRIGHREREQAVEALGEHYGSGRLTGDEYSERVAQAWESRTWPEVAALFADLPEPRPGAAPLHPAPPGGPPPGGPGGSGDYLAAPPPAPWSAPGVVGMVDPSAPYGRDPRTGEPYSEKSKIIAGVLQLFLPFGVGRFYSGHIGIAVAQLVLSLFFIGVIWSFIDGIVLLAGSPRDTYGRPMHG